MKEYKQFIKKVENYQNFLFDNVSRQNKLFVELMQEMDELLIEDYLTNK